MNEQLRDYLIGLLCAQAIAQAIEEATEGMKKVHHRFNTRLGFPVVLCSGKRMSLTDNFPGWHKTAPMTTDSSKVTCENCKRELEKY